MVSAATVASCANLPAFLAQEVSFLKLSDLLACPGELYDRLLQMGVNLFKIRLGLTGGKSCLMKGFLESGLLFPATVNVAPSVVKIRTEEHHLTLHTIRSAPKLAELTLHRLGTCSLHVQQFSFMLGGLQRLSLGCQSLEKTLPIRDEIPRDRCLGNRHRLTEVAKHMPNDLQTHIGP